MQYLTQSGKTNPRDDRLAAPKAPKQRRRHGGERRPQPHLVTFVVFFFFFSPPLHSPSPTCRRLKSTQNLPQIHAAGKRTQKCTNVLRVTGSQNVCVVE